MSKEPAFLFYPNDWLGGTMYFTFEQKGCYLEILLMQASVGKFTETQVKQVLNTCYSSVWEVIKHKFLTDGTYFWNKKMLDVLEKRRTFTESRRLNRLGKTQEKDKSNTSKTHVKHVGNGNGDIGDIKGGMGEKKGMDLNNLISEFGNKYTEEMLNAFFNYWSEKDKKGKERWQKQETWETSKRLATWHNNNFGNNYNKNKVVPIVTPKNSDFKW